MKFLYLSSSMLCCLFLREGFLYLVGLSTGEECA